MGGWVDTYLFVETQRTHGIVQSFGLLGEFLGFLLLGIRLLLDCCFGLGG